MDNLGAGAANDLADRPSTENVRSRISTWITGIVDEVRRNSPSTLQKWTDPDTASTDDSINQPNKSKLANFNRTLENLYEGATKHTDEKTLHKFLNKFQFSKQTQSSSNEFVDCMATEECSRSKIPNLTNSGESIMNEICDKVRSNQLKSGQSDLELLDVNVTLNTAYKVNSEMEKVNSIAKNLPENYIPVTEPDTPTFEQFRNDITLGLIGRTSTYNENIWLNTPNKSPETASAETGPTNCITSPRQIRKDKLSVIFRSYSEQEEDNTSLSYDQPDHLLNTRSRSFIHIKGENNPDSENPENDDRNNENEQDTVSSSLPSFLDKSGRQSGFTLKNNIDLSFELDRRKNILMRDNSYQSDSSHCSSVDSLLESRKPDPEAILINLGFGPIDSEDVLSRIPKRFLKPSQVKGIDTEAFLRRQKIANNIHDHSVLGYRGLVGNPDIPPSTIVAKIMERFELNDRSRGVGDINMNRPQSAPPNSMDSYKF